MSDATPGPGAIVRAQRELRGLTRQDIADTLNLGARVVEDMETENWTRLPAPAFTRGYLRAYAKLLDIDADVVANAFDAAVSRGEMRATVVTSMQRSHHRGLADLSQKHPGVVLTGAVAGVACAVVIVLWAVWPDVAVREPVAATEPAGPAEVAISQRVSNEATVTEPQATAAVAAGSGNASVVASSATVAAQPVLHDDRGARRITSDGDDRLKFAFTDDCWVEIKDAQGSSIFRDVGKSGDSLELIGRPPFHILLGNAPAVSLAFNGERVALSPHTRNNVGTLVLGQ